ncbi:MAG TPA: bifunctional phosphoribosyl-AMP cyclohydrolase/phosphoribosyl-ATP diphosphatase HisIE [Longimicrobiales bacterium]|nr:bifunctional phosphoribosyl-AMP cyclohydrolase/phosphoribosyl-ATP diphosphatase HisIE [Longimicrobiales bacterium]
MRIDDSAALDRLDFARGGGLIAVIAQHAHTGEVLMLAYANREALERTLAERVMWYFSRSRDELWRKGDTSGNVQRVVSLHGDCDGDAILARVLPAGPACHTGAANCFDAAPTLTALDRVITDRAQAPAGSSYTQKLLSDHNLRLKKLGEEAVELALACEREDGERITEEAADLLYHALVACRAGQVSVEAVLAVLAGRGAEG